MLTTLSGIDKSQDTVNNDTCSVRACDTEEQSNERQDIGHGHGIGGFQRRCYGCQRAYTACEGSQGSVQDGAWQAEVQEATQEPIQACQGQVI